VILRPKRLGLREPIPEQLSLRQPGPHGHQIGHYRAVVARRFHHGTVRLQGIHFWAEQDVAATCTPDAPPRNGRHGRVASPMPPAVIAGSFTSVLSTYQALNVC
jgi:hypothetical protein